MLKIAHTRLPSFMARPVHKICQTTMPHPASYYGSGSGMAMLLLPLNHDPFLFE